VRRRPDDLNLMPPVDDGSPEAAAAVPGSGKKA
jgi:hypothetical protein